MSHHHIHTCYAASDLLVLASRDSRNPVTSASNVETMCRVLCEATATGMPVLASRSDGILSVIHDGDNGLLFDPENIRQLTEEIQLLHAQPELRNQLATRGQFRAREEFDWQHILAGHLAVFPHTLESGTVRVPSVIRTIVFFAGLGA